MRIYLDVVVLLNFLVDLFLFIGTNRLSGFSVNFPRCVAAALAGGLYGGVCLLRGFRFLSAWYWRILILACLSMLAFGIDRSAFKRGGIFLLLSMSLGGISLSIGSTNAGFLLAAAVGVLLLCYFLFDGTIGKCEYLPVSIAYGDRSVSLIALRDTGNTLRDPFTGEPVYLISPGAAFRLTGLSQEQLRCPMDTLSQRPLPGLRLIPFSAIGTKGGMLLAMRFDEVRIGNQVRSAVIAFAPEGLGEGQCYQALVT